MDNLITYLRTIRGTIKLKGQLESNNASSNALFL